MEKFFKPVHCPSLPEKNQKWRHHQHQRFRHQQETDSQRYLKLEGSDSNTDDTREHHSKRNQYVYDSSPHDVHYLHQSEQREDNGKLHNHQTSVTLSRASSSSLSSTSSTSSSSWFTEASVNDPFLLRHADRPQHSLSCSNISEMRTAFKEDDDNEPLVFATIKHSKQGNVDSGLHPSRMPEFSNLNRGHSRSEEGFLQCNESDGGRERSKMADNCRSLYKTTSLNRCLAFSEEDIVLGIPMGPKRAISSMQLPSKGILKNKENNNDIRKAKSMEVLSPRVAKGKGQTGQKDKAITQAEMERARLNFVEGKLQFSAFLDEITKQVMSPSELSILGVSRNKSSSTTTTPVPTLDPVRPELPPKKHRLGKQSDTQQDLKHPSRQGKVYGNPRKHSDCANPDKLTSYAVRKHRGSPPPRQLQQSASHCHGARRPPPPGDSMSGDRFGRHGSRFTDGTSTSPEPIQPKHQHRKHPPNPSHDQRFQEAERREPNTSPPSSSQGAAPGFGSESSSTKSDSSRGRETVSAATSPSSEQSWRQQPTRGTKQCKEMLCDKDHVQALQEENADLHQNLLQTVVCIESLEAELQRTRDELSQVKEKYKSLLQSHTETEPPSNLLEENLHMASESLSNDRKFLLNRVSQLGSELEAAHRTIATLENINIPFLMKELLTKYFGSAEAIQNFLSATFSLDHPQQTEPSQTPRGEGAGRGWPSESQAASQKVTAFMQVKSEDGVPSRSESSRAPPAYKTISTSFPTRPQPLYPSPKLQTSRFESTGDQELLHAGAESWDARGGMKVLLFEQDAEDVNSKSAQQILDDFMQHLKTQKEAARLKELHGGREWMNGGEQTGKLSE